MDKLTLILAIYSIIMTLAALWLWLSRREIRRWNTHQAIEWFWHRNELEQRIAELREMVNKSRRNTGKAEV